MTRQMEMGGNVGTNPGGVVRSTGADTPMGTTHGAPNGEQVEERSEPCEVQGVQRTKEAHQPNRKMKKMKHKMQDSIERD